MEPKKPKLERNLDFTKVDNPLFEATMKKHQDFITEAWTDLSVVLADVIGAEKLAKAIASRIEAISMTPRTDASRDLLADALRAVERRGARPDRPTTRSG